MAPARSHIQPVTPATLESSGVGPDLLPGPYESGSEYLERLRAHHKRVGALIDTIEERRPAGVPGRQERTTGDRRYLDDERRTGVTQRRDDNPDTRTVLRERRAGARERRGWRVPRREGLERRRHPLPVPWEGKLRADRVTAIWAVQIIAWLAVAVVALSYGIGRWF
jgi:hypothetical protein